ncbi:MAG: extracellular solute-binding protein [Chloroflexi bacterium]|nr:extracellular solute-binding protein [Chloroflexota bacterium]
MTALLQQEEAWLGFWNTARVTQIAKTGFPAKMAYMKEGIPGYTNGVGLVKGGPNRDTALQFIEYILSEEGQLAVQNAFGGAPTVEGAKQDPEIAKFLPTPEQFKTVYTMDVEAIAAGRAAILDKWAKEIESAKR